MIDRFIIENDFNVQFISEQLEQQIYADIKGVSYHIIFVTDNIIYQVSVHRFELANKIYNFNNREDKLQETSVSILSNNVILRIVKEYNKFVFKLGINGKTNILPFIFDDSPIEKTINNDIKLLQQIKTVDSIKQNFKKDTLNNLATEEEEPNKIILDTLSDIEYELIAFEYYLFEYNVDYEIGNCMYELYFNIYANFLDIDSLGIQNFNYSLNLVVGKIIDNNESELEKIFFSKLKENELKYFSKYDLLNNNSLDSDKVEKSVNALWEELNVKQQSALLFTARYVGGSLLFNMSFLDEDFDVNYYISLVSTPFQPDSEDMRRVLVGSSLVNYFLRINLD